MTDLEFTILKTLYNQPNREAHRKVLFCLDEKNPSNILSVISDLVEFELIKKVVSSDYYKLTKKGLKALHLANQERDQASKQESQQRFDNNVSVTQVLVPLVIFILGLLVDFVVALLK